MFQESPDQQYDPQSQQGQAPFFEACLGTYPAGLVPFGVTRPTFLVFFDTLRNIPEDTTCNLCATIHNAVLAAFRTQTKMENLGK